MKDWELAILTLEWCDYCKQTKERLDNLNIPYINLDATQHPEIATKLEQYYGCNFYPILILTKPINIIWLSETFMELSNSIRVFKDIDELTEDIFKIFNQ